MSIRIQTLKRREAGRAPFESKWLMVIFLTVAIILPGVVASNASTVNPPKLAIDSWEGSAQGQIGEIKESTGPTPPQSCSSCVIANISVGVRPYVIVYDDENKDLYVTDAGSNEVSVISGSNNTLVQSIPVGNAPWGEVYDNVNGDLYVANGNSNSVSVISTSTNTVINSIPVNGSPTGITLDTNSGNLYVTDATANNVSVISTSSASIIATIPVGNFPQGIKYDVSNSDIYVADGFSTNVSVISDSSNTVIQTVKTGDRPWGLGYDGANGDIYVVNGESDTVSVIASSNITVIKTLPVGDGPNGLAYDSENGDMYSANYRSNNVSIISGANNTVIANVAVGSGSAEVAYDDTTGFLYVSNYYSGTVSVLSPPTTTIPLQASIVFDSPTIGHAPLQVTASGNATGGESPYSYFWEFGDGSTSNGQLVSHSYNAAPVGCVTGQCVYQLSLTVTDALGTIARASSQVVILVNSTTSFNISMSISPATGVAPLQVSMVANGSGGMPPYNFSWVFGDGSISSGAMLQHTYSSPGAFTVVLTGDDRNGSIVQVTSTVVVSPPPVGNESRAIELEILADPVTGPAPLQTHLQVSATGGKAPYTFVWSLGDNSTNLSGASILHVYGNPGIYVASVVGRDSEGNQATTGVFITVIGNANEPNNLALVVTTLQDHGTSPLTVVFTTSVRGGSAPYLFSWNFGDGGKGMYPSNQSVIHVYKQPGKYVPSLIVTDASGSAAIWPSAVPGVQDTIVVTSIPKSGGSGLFSTMDWILTLGSITFVAASISLIKYHKKCNARETLLRTKP